MGKGIVRTIRAAVGAIVAGTLVSAVVGAQGELAPKAREHMALAEAAATTRDALELYESACRNLIPLLEDRGFIESVQSAAGEAPAPGGRGRGAGPNAPAWNAAPVQVFDNLYYNLGTPGVSTLVITTSEGLILMDAATDEVLDGIRTLGFDPMDIKYVIISHAHGDHFGGARFLQEQIPGVQVISSAADWDGMERQGAAGRGAAPRRDMVVADGDTLTLGDTTVTFYVTPGHTAGTVSPLVTVFDNGTPHVAAEWGGLGAGLRGDVNGRFGPGDEAYYRTYAASAYRFRDVVTEAGADVLLAPHPGQAGANWKVPGLATRQPGDPHPFVIGAEGVRNAMTAIAECASALAEQEAMYPAER